MDLDGFGIAILSLAMLAAEGYALQMYGRVRGHALFDPYPGKRLGDGDAVIRKPHARIGDVGYILNGAFHRLFNVHLARDDPGQTSNVPDYFEPAPRNPDRTDYRSRSTPGVHLSSSSREVKFKAGASMCVSLDS